VKIPQGFWFSGVHAGLKPNRPDLALVHSETPCSAAGVFTVNTARAAPVLDAAPRLPGEGFHSVVLNSGNANALTGSAGLEDVRTILEAAAKALQVKPSAVLAASTGVIGVRLPAKKIVDAIPTLAASLAPRIEAAADAIMTTDTRPKMALREIQLGGRPVVISAIAKGSGMIAPQLATMLAVITTDAAIKPGPLSGALRKAVGGSFNNLTVDGDMSTNDSVFALANGRAGNPQITDPGPDLQAFEEALASLCTDLAKQIAGDGEGATKMVEVRVSGAPDDASARDIARSIAGSSLVKAAIFGADPNWGRVLSTVGARAGSQGWPANPVTATVRIQGVCVYAGGPAVYDVESLRSKMRAPNVEIEVDLVGGKAASVAWGCDLSYDYVKINADYTSTIVEKPDGSLARDDRLTNYSPSFKKNLLVEALSYIQRFAGKRAVIKYGGAGMVKDSLKEAFAEDVLLLRSVGLYPIVVHGGGPEITHTLEKLGVQSEFVDGMRVTNTSDLQVVEMVLTGKINQGIVSLLNRTGSHAVGISGKDGGLIRARKLVADHGRDLGQVGEVISVNRDFIEMLLAKSYIPVISPIGLGEDGASYNINADAVAAEIATAVGAFKLIYLTDVPGVLENGELVMDLPVEELMRRVARGSITGGMKAKARSIARAFEGGIERAHVIDGRTPHSVIAELFTDRGVGTLVTR
jgi:acetylglutamate kinase